MISDQSDEFEWPKWTLGKYHGWGNTFLVKLIEVPPNSLDEIKARVTTGLATSLEDLLANNAGVLHPDNPPLKGEYLAAIAAGICDEPPRIGEAGETSGGYVDGLIIGLCPFSFSDTATTAGDLTVGMVLRNSNGSDGQVSGNGFRCLAHAILRATNRDEASIGILTATGFHPVEAERGSETEPKNTANAAVNMGRLRLFDSVTPAGDPEIEAGVKDAIHRASEAILFSQSEISPDNIRAAYGTIGNPHLVIDAGDVSEALSTIADKPTNVNVRVLNPFKDFGGLLTYGKNQRLGIRFNRKPYPEGINVEFISAAPPTDAAPHENAINMIVWERGAGITKACGTGAVVAAAQAAQWGLVDRTAPVTVHMPGGSARVHLSRSHPDPAPVLIGPSVYLEDHIYDFYADILT